VMPPTTMPVKYNGSNKVSSRAPCRPRTDQVAILSEHDKLIVGVESARPGFVRTAPKFPYPFLPRTA
jgi:hypothetical protein